MNTPHAQEHLLIAREICADLMISWGRRTEGMAYRDGAYDHTVPVTFAFAKLEAAYEAGRASK